MPATSPPPARGPNRVETQVAVLEKSFQTLETTNSAMLHEMRGLRADLDKLWKETLTTYVPQTHCNAVCGRREQQLSEVVRDFRSELEGVRDGLDERVRSLEQGTAGLRGAMPVVLSSVSLIGTLAMAALNLAAKGAHL